MDVEFQIEVRRAGVLVGTAPASVAQCVEDALFRGVLAGRLPNDGALPPFGVRPRPDGGLELDHPGAPAERYDLQVFAPQARALLMTLFSDGRLQGGEKVRWHVVARPSARPAPRFAARASRTPLPLRRERLPGVPQGEMRVRVAAAVLRDFRERVAATPDVERAGLLLGTLAHDPDRGAAELRVDRLIDLEAGAGGASASHFAFEPTAFARARAEAGRAANGEIPVGWVHSHPPCERCPQNPDCTSDTLFFSGDDVEVHSSAFASPFMVGLVAGKLGPLPAKRTAFRLYGWELAQVVERRFDVCGAGAERWCEKQNATFEVED